MELQLPHLVWARLRSYLESGATGHTEERTAHWAFYVSQSRVSVTPDGSTVRFNAGAGFDDFFESNFSGSSVRQRLRQSWRLWRGRRVAHIFAEAFRALHGAGALDLPRVAEMLGMPLTPHKILAAHYVNLIHPHAPRHRVRYLEIGAGTGYLAALMRSMYGFRIIIVDLPEIIPFSYLYLTRLFPAADVWLPQEVQGGRAFPLDADLVFLTPDQAGLIPDRSIDFAANTASFGEMLPPVIDRYFRLLRRTLTSNGLFFTANRVEKHMSPSHAERGANTEQSIPVRFEDYPWRPADRDIFFCPSRFHERVQPGNPFLQRLCHLAAG
jgi:hypothetical protein